MIGIYGLPKVIAETRNDKGVHLDGKLCRYAGSGFQFRPGNPGSGVVPQSWMFIHSIVTSWNQRFQARPFGYPFWQPV